MTELLTRWMPITTFETLLETEFDRSQACNLVHLIVKTWLNYDSRPSSPNYSLQLWGG